MESSANTESKSFWIAIAFGGSLIGALSAFQQKATNDKQFSFRPVFRDFFFGAFLTAILYILLPESIQSIFSSIPSFSMPFPQIGGGEGGNPDLQLGPAPF